MTKSERNIGPVLVGVDFSDESTTVAQWVGRHFAPGAEVVFVHSLVTPEWPAFLPSKWALPDSFIQNASAGAEQRLRDLALTIPDARVSVRVTSGRPAEALADIARELHASLIAVGKHGHRGTGSAYTGSTTDGLMRISQVPVLMVAGEFSAAPKRILVALTFSSLTPLILKWTKKLSEQFSASVFGVHVIASAVLGHVLSMAEVTEHKSLTKADVDEVFSNDRSGWQKELLEAGIPGERLNTEITFGNVAQEVLAIADREKAELIVMGSHAGRVRRALLGSSASAVLRNAGVPVLVVLAPEDE